MKRIILLFLECVTSPGLARRSRRCRRRAVLVTVLTWLLLAAPPAFAAEAGEMLAGPVPAVVEEVIDDDTLRVRVRIWLGQEEATLRLASRPTRLCCPSLAFWKPVLLAWWRWWSRDCKEPFPKTWWKRFCK